nr:soluble scavenger receptor cysteine-rich domain-containing protein SSC5D-like [Anser cygnoides]XP_047910959.1 soluble scavenger receptor cysteine-rich domain-containing protein SSC5D-like [Anser cygnoides]XP_047911020.1 soluble scavenger receptor cysteine-rich domain-containing protein SSC5D-like [Anser cygnoides]
MATTMILSWMVMMSLHIQVDTASIPPTTDTPVPTTIKPTEVIADELELRLTDGPNRCAGNVEIDYFGMNVKVCGFLWDMDDAQVVCRQLDCGLPVSVMNYFPSSDSYPWYHWTAVDCKGSETSLLFCPYEHSPSDCHHGAASVVCSVS